MMARATMRISRFEARATHTSEVWLGVRPRQASQMKRL